MRLLGFRPDAPRHARRGAPGPGGGRMRRRLLILGAGASLLGLTAPGSALTPDPAEAWRDATVRSEPAAHDVLPQIAAMHEWWFFTVQNPGGGGDCGPWQAMAAFVSDVEAGEDILLFTAVIDGKPHNWTRAYDYGTFGYAITLDNPPSGYEVFLDGDNRASTARGLYGPQAWNVAVTAPEAILRLGMVQEAPTLWYRQSPEGWGLLEIIFTVRATAAGSLTVGDRTCAVTGTGFFEHVWGNWSRVPQLGVDYLNAHADGGWSAYARRTPMRGEGNLYPAVGQDPDDTYPPALIVTDGETVAAATDVTMGVTEWTEPDPDLGIPLPAAWEVTGWALLPGVGPEPVEVRLEVDGPTLARILLPLTSSGILEGWAPAVLTVDGQAMPGTAEIEVQRFGTAFPH